MKEELQRKAEDDKRVRQANLQLRKSELVPSSITQSLSKFVDGYLKESFVDKTSP
jgi:hypothetical protein